MNIRSKIELLVVICIILAKAWNLQQQFGGGGIVTMLFLGGAVLATLGCLLWRMTGLAFVLALGSIFSAAGLLRVYAFAPFHSIATSFSFAREEAIYLALALCLLDLWSEWRRSGALVEVRV